MTNKSFKLILAIGLFSILGFGISSQAIAGRSLATATVAQSNPGRFMTAANSGDRKIPDRQETSSSHDQGTVQASSSHVDRGDGDGDGEANDDGGSSRANSGRGRNDGDGETNDGPGNAGRGGNHQTGHTSRGGHSSNSDQGGRSERD